MNDSQVFSLIGVAYKEGSFGPPEEGFNCWGLLHYVQNNYFSVNMPKAPIGDEAACLELFKEKMDSGLWALADQPKHGDGALMRGGVRPHVGIYLEVAGGGILHALEGVGVIFTKKTDLSFHGFGRTKYYRLKNDSESSYPS